MAADYQRSAQDIVYSGKDFQGEDTLANDTVVMNDDSGVIGIFSEISGGILKISPVNESGIVKHYVMRANRLTEPAGDEQREDILQRARHVWETDEAATSRPFSFQEDDPATSPPSDH